MSDHDLNWKYVDESVVETESIVKARQQSLELGIEPVSPAMGAQLAVLAAATRAESIIEVGTGVGVSGLWMLQAARRAMLTSIDTETEYQQHARQHFADAGIAAARVRLIAGRASEVLPRMNESSYDVVFIDADGPAVIEYAEHGLRLAKPGGVVLVARALWRGRVADPARRDEAASAFRTLIGELAASTAVATAISPAGDGLLQIVKLGA
ncbi:class I SAM-dependent methyltransferase [Agromyces sp. ISL-38]|uniref:O-methyltransferase n=1 Tax=Agromyces sp. ISL-38 TaxID=2819107 RepID=UPI001BEB82F7|nr:class I SAM-dependent methyltransferase [Agromyces sp. ISL-38]MBT2498908.1 class I SAM-dependent methyltransferase [Agromyces sp. ISL-38]MBT2516406.1 class I SAM-dependent methyltransferase [Streptomyces sp. ISL-90]